MNESESKTLVIDIHLTKGVAIALTGILVILVFLTVAVWTQRRASAQGAAEIAAATSSTADRRQFYRTSNSYLPTAVDSACATGYHFASLWEILDPTQLEYNGTLGWTEADSGEGPPTYRHGWIRTGYNSSGNSYVVGQDNCSNWSSVDSNDRGTIVSLSWQWGIVEDIGVWDASQYTCDVPYPVWCVED